jgi:hypothetical protein
MGRVVTFIIFLMLISIILELGGMGLLGSRIISELGISGDTVNTGIDLSNTKFWIGVIAILAGASVVGLGISFFTKSQGENYVVLPLIVGSMIVFTDVLVGMVKEVGSASPWIGAVILVFGVILGIVYLVTMVDWFRGNVT